MKRRYIISIITFIGFILITALLLTNNIKGFDDTIYNFFYQLRDNNFIKTFFISITRLGDTISFLIILLILLIILEKKYKILLLANVSVTVLVNQVLKHIIERPRPPLVERLVTQNGFSYPSGHAMTSTCLYGILIYIINKEIKNKIIKCTLIALCMFMIISIGLSRIFVRVHYPSDVLSGCLLTITLLVATIGVVNHFLERGKSNEKDVCK